jgi:hypothetical protein
VVLVVVVTELIAMALLPRETLGEPDHSPRDDRLDVSMEGRKNHHPYHLA